MRCYSSRRCRLWVASGGSQRLGGPYHFFAVAATACGRRQSGGLRLCCGRGILLAACRHFVGLSPGPSPSLRFWGGEFGRLCLLVGFCVRVGCEPRDRMKTFLQNRIFQAEVCIHAHAHSALTRRACGPRRDAGRQKSREIVILLSSFTPPRRP